MQDGSYSDKDKQVHRVLKESDGLYKNEVIMWMIQNSQLTTMLMPLMILVMKMVKLTGKNCL